MQRTTLSLTVLGLLLFYCGGALVASEADELRERAQAMREKVAQESANMLEAADRLELNAKGHGEDGEHSGIKKEVRHLKEQLQGLLAQEKKLRESNAPEKEMA